jgi:hypothetical protein
MTRHQLEVADVFREHATEYLERFGASLSTEQRRVLRDVTQCRTAALGGHIEACDACGHQRIAYNSCRNRHCPKCQGEARRKWLEQRSTELVSVPYFHVVFTLPGEIAPVALQNPRAVYGILFRAAAETLLEIAADRKHMGADIGFLAVLHTWGQNLLHHPHLHCVVPGGGFAVEGDGWVNCSKDFFLPVRVLSLVFRGKFIAYLKQAFREGNLAFHGRLTALNQVEAFEQRLNTAVRSDWVVYAKPPFGGPEQVLKYLARYTHRVAISNRRLIKCANGQVRFHYKDYTQGSAMKEMTLTACEFIRRFLLHTLPRGFVKIRQFGFLANRVRRERLASARGLLAAQDDAVATVGCHEQAPPATTVPTPITHRCPSCGVGEMVLMQRLLPGWGLSLRVTPDQPIIAPDTS